MRSGIFSIIIPALHEGAEVNSLVEGLFDRFRDESFEIIIVDGDPDGSTIKEIQNPYVITVTAKPGRGSQMNAGARLAQGKILIFLHADTELSLGALQYIRSVLADPRYVDPSMRDPAFVKKVDEGFKKLFA